MPTYGYQCTQCQHEFSVFQAMKDEPIQECPNCGGKVKRLLYPVGVVFKGSGWYINDSRKPDTSESAPATKAEANGGDKPADFKSETKIEPKQTEAKSETPTPAATADK